MTGFAIEVYQNEYLPDSVTEVNAVLTVTASGAVSAAGTAAAEVIVIDCSGSMEYPRDKMAAAIRATEAAVDALRDGVEFAVVAGTGQARLVYPAAGLVAAGAKTRAAAKAAVRRLKPEGGTAIGRWLALASQLFEGREGALKHVILLTDGRNEHEKPEELERVLAACAGRFVCDCRGVGTGWQVAELRRVATALLGTVDIVADPAGLAADFRAMATAAMGKSVADVALRLWTPQSAKVKFVKQVAPEVVDLTGKRTESGPRTGDYPTGSWGAESRDYQLCVEVTPGRVGDVMLAARASLVAGADVLAQGLVKAVWTDDAALSTRISKEVAHYTGQAELAA
ncbi:VWA domain-containing protein [Amycolatopsis sp. CA-126428]|uniref:VWA domain-containing protein n=1 Tax=Amycolatopsis sp. CA-126428 TaxID=2073158 RepID=UPI001E37E7EB|nr:vWA domain-containing protein [Amycolatopsis sp. CA-126428]